MKIIRYVLIGFICFICIAADKLPYYLTSPLRIETFNPKIYKVRKRQYSDVLLRIKALNNFTRTHIGSVTHGNIKYALYTITYNSTGQIPLVFTSGVHGDEPGSVEGLLRFAEAIDKNPLQYKKYSIVIFPLINIWGWEHHVRYNYEGYDLNRVMYNYEAKEAKLLRDVFMQMRSPALMIDHHEAWAKGAFIYVGAGNYNIAANELMNFLHNQHNYVIDDNYAQFAKNGVITYYAQHHSARTGRRGITQFFADEVNAAITYTLETSKNRILTYRANAHMFAIDFLLDAFFPRDSIPLLIASTEKKIPVHFNNMYEHNDVIAIEAIEYSHDETDKKIIQGL